MEDCCAVCAEPLEWVAYGPCGHRDVCFTCTARMRFVLEDKRCCICKQDCPSVYVTKALGDYTKVLTDFSGLEEQLHLKEKGGMHLWYESNVQAYFDDEEPFRLIKAMCRLYCSVCENVGSAGLDQPLAKGAVKKGHIFKSIDSLRRHLFSFHRLIMCDLCLSGRKVFICEQNLFTRSQLDRHSDKGDSEVDGTEEERGGFTGHPICEFCRKRFYGENELYQHMSTEHYTCHLCQRSRPGHFEYYRNYDDLEMHFRDKHSLCEHSDCLNKKFVVFTSEAELKRHNATTHGGNMSRSQRNAALQIPVSFQFRRPGQDSVAGNGIERRGYGRGARGRGRSSSNADNGSNSLDAAIQATLEQAFVDDAVRESNAMAASIADSGGGRPSTRGDTAEGANSFAALDTEAGEGEPVPSRYASAVSGTGPSSLVDSAFPPLPGVSKRGKHKPKNQPASMAALFGGGGRGGGLRVLNAADPRLSTGASSSRTSSSREALSSGRGNSNNSRLSPAREEVRPGGWASSTASQGLSVGGNRSDAVGRLQSTSAVGSLGPQSGPSPDGGSASTSVRQMISPVSQVDGAQSVHKLSMEEIRAANKALIEHIQSGLEGNEQQFSDFKDVSARFRKGEMSAFDYNGRISRLGLSYVVPELARLCPDPVKCKELIEAHTAGLAREQAFPSVASSTVLLPQSSRNSGETRKGKGEREGSSSTSNLSGSSSRSLQPPTEVVEVLSTDGYRSAKGKFRAEESSRGSSEVSERVTLSKPQVLVKATQRSLEDTGDSTNQTASSGQAKDWACEICTLKNSVGNPHCEACGLAGPSGEVGKVERGVDSRGNDKQKKKLPKFQRMRLGDGSAAALLDSVNPNPWATSLEIGNPTPPANGNRSVGGGAWNNGGGRRLASISQRDLITDSAWGRK